MRLLEGQKAEGQKLLEVLKSEVKKLLEVLKSEVKKSGSQEVRKSSHYNKGWLWLL